MRRRWLPHPAMSLGLLAMWLVLNSTLAPGHVLLGALLGWAIPLFTHRLHERDVVVRRPMIALRLLATVLGDIVVANLNVARLVLGPPAALRPAFVRVPLRLEQPAAVWTLASIITLTPGTVSSALSADRKWLLVHVLDLESEQDLIEEIRQRYERPLQEIFK